jgi:hypothetical protein
MLNLSWISDQYNFFFIRDHLIIYVQFGFNQINSFWILFFSYVLQWDWFGLYDIYRHFQQYFSYIVAVNFIGVGNWSTRRRPLICRKSLTNFIT